MKRIQTQPDLTDWIKEPIHTGSIYIKPTKEKTKYCTKCFAYFWYFFCCGYIRNR